MRRDRAAVRWPGSISRSRCLSRCRCCRASPTRARRHGSSRPTTPPWCRSSTCSSAGPRPPGSVPRARTGERSP
jgi:hypothetical protein